MYVYILSEKACADNDFTSLWTVGFYDPAGEWHAESDYDSYLKAAQRVNYLNGGTKT